MVPEDRESRQDREKVKDRNGFTRVERAASREKVESKLAEITGEKMGRLQRRGRTDI